MSNRYNDVVVITVLTINYQVESILIDPKSSLNIIFKFILDKLRLANSKLAPIKGGCYVISWKI